MREHVGKYWLCTFGQLLQELVVCPVHGFSYSWYICEIVDMCWWCACAYGGNGVCIFQGTHGNDVNWWKGDGGYYVYMCTLYRYLYNILVYRCLVTGGAQSFMSTGSNGVHS